MILVRSSKKRRSSIKASLLWHQGKWYVLDKFIIQSGHCIVNSAFVCFNWTIWKQTDCCQGSWLVQNALTGIVRQRNMNVIAHLQKLRLHSVLVSVSPTDIASFTSFVLACNSFFFLAFLLRFIFVSLKEFDSTCIWAYYHSSYSCLRSMMQSKTQ